MKTTKPKSFKSTLDSKLKEAAITRRSEGRNNSPSRIIADTTGAINAALEASTNKVTLTPKNN